MLASLSAAMFTPAIADLQDDGQAAHAFFGAGAFGLALGGIMTLMGRGTAKDLTPRGAILLTGGAWIVLSVRRRNPAQTVRAGHQLDRRAV